jgi:hypothetical protein
MSENTQPTAAPVKAEYQIVQDYYDGHRLHRAKGRPGAGHIRVDPNLVPSVTWIPLNEPARIAHEKQLAEVNAKKAVAEEAAKMKDPAYLLQLLIKNGGNMAGAGEQVARQIEAAKELKAKEAELAEARAELEALREKEAERTRQVSPLADVVKPEVQAPGPVDAGPAVPPPAAPAPQGVQGGDVGTGASPGQKARGNNRS